MDTDSLYAEVACGRCGKSRLKSSTFCPHCGAVHEETWFDRLKDRIGGGLSRGGGGFSLSHAISIGVLAIAAIFAVDAIADGRYGDLISIVVLVLISLRTFFRRKRSGVPPSEHVAKGPERAASDGDVDDLATHYACENCGIQVAGDAQQCPKCGTRFA